MTAIDNAASLGRLTARAAPVIATTTVLAAARAWNADGAQHSMGAAVLMAAFAAGSGAAGYFSASGTNGHPGISAVAFSAAGTFGMAGVAAYSDGLPLPILLWLIATVAAYAVCAHYWRDDRRATTEHGRVLEVRAVDHRHQTEVEAIRARAARDIAETAQSAVAAAQLTAAWQHRQTLDAHPELAGLDLASKVLFGDADDKAER